MKYTDSNQWYQEYGKEVMDKNEFSEFEKYLNNRRQNGSHTLDEWEDLYDDFLKDFKKSMRNSIKENKMILSFEAFKDICVEEIGYSHIGSFDEHKGTYFVSVIDDKRADKFCKYLRDNYDCECTFWKITDPYDDDYGLYEIEVI